MRLKYVGPKPIISHTGIDFDNNKEDKFAYLNIVVQLLKALNHEYFEDKVYKYNTETHRLNNDELFRELERFCPNLNSIIKAENHTTEDKVEHTSQRAKESDTLTDQDKKTLQNNLNIMHDYILQRAINKRVYYCAVDALAQLLKNDHIDYIIAPMFQKFAHVLHSVQGVLQKGKTPIDTKLDIYQEDGQLLVKLQVQNI